MNLGTIKIIIRFLKDIKLKNINLYIILIFLKKELD
jgi:hypothetical protein